jgi:hypothetical protein
MVKRLSAINESHKKAARVPKSRGGSQKAAETRLVNWVESDIRPSVLGHGVQFLHDELKHKYVVAFLEGFEWLHRHGEKEPTVRLLGICPPEITTDHWSQIMESTRQAVLVFLSDDANLKYSFRHGPITILING